jgi:hypothetical protein
MVSLTALWLPILLSSVAVFVLSSVIHMVLTYHRHDYDQLPDEDALIAHLRAQKAGPGNYIFPCALTAQERKDPAVIQKMTEGPAGFINVMSGFKMGMSLVSWFVVCLLISTVVALLASITFDAGTASKLIFHFVALAALLGYAGATASDSIWMGRRWSTTFRHVFDAVLFALATAGIFAWLWP